MTISNSVISDGDRGLLALRYKYLLDNRQAMIDGLVSWEPSAYFRGVMIDSIISGLMEHFIEVASNPTVFREELDNWGGDFNGYTVDRSGQIRGIFTKLSTPSQPSQTTSEGRPAGKR